MFVKAHGLTQRLQAFGRHWRGAHVEGLGDPGERDGELRVERGDDLGFARVAFLEAGKLRGTQLGEAQTFLEKPLGRTRFGSGVSTTK